MAQLRDARGNEFLGLQDQIGAGTFTDGRTSSATLGALNNEIAMDLNGHALARFDLRPTSFVGTLIFEGSQDGTNFYPLNAPLDAFISSTPAHPYIVNISGWRRVRCRVSAYTSGSLVAFARATAADEFVPPVTPFAGGGSYVQTFQTGSMAAALAANSEIVQFRNPSTTLLSIVERVDLLYFYATTGFTVGIAQIGNAVARAWTGDGSGGTALTLTGNIGKTRTGFNTCASTIRVATTAALTAGTKTLDDTPDTTPFQRAGACVLTVPATTNVNFVPAASAPLLEPIGNGYPLVLGREEGFVIKATVPATGVWLAGFRIKWSEAIAF